MKKTLNIHADTKDDTRRKQIGGGKTKRRHTSQKILATAPNPDSTPPPIIASNGYRRDGEKTANSGPENRRNMRGHLERLVGRSVLR